MRPPSGGVLSRTEPERALQLKSAVSEYFYGPTRELSPKRLVMGYVDLEIYQLGGGMSAGASMLPIGEESSIDHLELTPVAKSKESLLNALCGVSLAESLDEVKSAAVAGFALISEVDPINQTITILAPCVPCHSSMSQSAHDRDCVNIWNGFVLPVSGDLARLSCRLKIARAVHENESF
eukprot:52963_2